MSRRFGFHESCGCPQAPDHNPLTFCFVRTVLNEGDCSACMALMCLLFRLSPWLMDTLHKKSPRGERSSSSSFHSFHHGSKEVSAPTHDTSDVDISRFHIFQHSAPDLADYVLCPLQILLFQHVFHEHIHSENLEIFFQALCPELLRKPPKVICVPSIHSPTPLWPQRIFGASLVRSNIPRQKDSDALHLRLLLPGEAARTTATVKFSPAILADDVAYPNPSSERKTTVTKSKYRRLWFLSQVHPS